jgi:hypothetical protein
MNNIVVRVGIAAAVVTLVAIVGITLLLGPKLGGPTQPPPSSAPSLTCSEGTTPAPASGPAGLYSPENLRRTILTEIGAPDSLALDDTKAGVAAIAFSPVGIGFPTIPAGFVDALTTGFNTTEAGGYLSWGALFETSPDAEHAFDLMTAEHESADGWGLEPSADPNLGTESVLYIGPAYGWDTATIYLWRSENLVLAAAGVGDYDSAWVRDIAVAMQFRALNW